MSPCISYIEKNFSDSSLNVIDRAVAICEDYRRQGYDLTLRQLYYQFVSRDLIANKDTEYKRLGSIINDARLAGLLDWDYIVDRTRNLRDLAHWNNPAELVRAASEQFRHDKWSDQPCRVEVWIEKDALVGVLESCCPGEDVPFFSCRGYTSQSEVWGAAQRLRRYIEDNQGVVIVHLGDHDPSGIDMTRDIEARVATFLAHDLGRARLGYTVEECVDELDSDFTVERIALNMDQVRRYSPPPNPAKLTDARVRGYISEYGSNSWELDALEPSVLVSLIRRAIHRHRDEELWDAATAREDGEREVLVEASARWDDVARFLETEA
jgi:hypothetical protein